MEKTCTCYVAQLPQDKQFSIRYGAHNPTCPKHRESLDPVDRAHDDELRSRYEQDTVRVIIIDALTGTTIEESVV
jgi:hypothetical protein